MLQIILIVAASYICGIAAGRREIPVWMAIAAAVGAGIFGGMIAGLAGSAVTCFIVVLAFVMIPIPGSQVAAIGQATQVDTDLPCPNCGRVLAATTKVCPRCMQRFEPSESLASNRGEPRLPQPRDRNPYAPPEFVSEQVPSTIESTVFAPDKSTQAPVDPANVDDTTAYCSICKKDVAIDSDLRCPDCKWPIDD